MSEPGPGTPAASGAFAEVETWGDVLGDDSPSLADLVNRLLDGGVVITGDVTISIAGVDLVYLGLNAVLTSVSTARNQLGRPLGGEPPGK